MKYFVLTLVLFSVLCGGQAFAAGIRRSRRPIPAPQAVAMSQAMVYIAAQRAIRTSGGTVGVYHPHGR